MRWRGLITPDHTFAVFASRTQRAPIRDARFAALRVKDAICDALRAEDGRRPSVDVEAPDVRVQVRLAGDRATISLDAAGRSLHARGYRDTGGPAPLRETLAAGVLGLARWDGLSPVLDPCCGSGTLPIEAALAARRLAPGLMRDQMGFERWPGHRSKRWDTLRAAAQEAVLPGSEASLVVGRDRRGGALAAARRHAQAAGVGEQIQFVAGSVADAVPPDGAPGLIVANPPYGERLGEIADATALYQDLGEVMRRRFSGWTAAVLVAHEEHERALGLRADARPPLKNGKLDVRLIVARI